ncbi:[FeFe] hydrogenase maturase subunit HydE [Campylobacter majalis]|uniref:[FeFe] hydrogenase maturase subunit HydE n=1 Tax=Campylobacter majalis TaxID=2790656 RepID=A0ABN7K507_9BACT|nr:[FeFe] hydrogenase H-cluster radical SAM maturase HydE [Campylobacter majalis]CAD7287525.1 [FeFe] hydrogenase maturase subunit HydE [Campylobacter majalis]
MSSLKYIDELAKNREISAYKLEKILADDECNEYLFALANATRKQYAKSEVHLKALIEISNICQKECFYCGLRKPNKELKRYKMSAYEIIGYAKQAASSGYKTIVLQSGESQAFSDELMCEILREIKNTGMQITLSLGEKSYKQYLMYKDAGADRYLLRIETTNKALYKKFHPNMSLKNRIKCLVNLKNLGYETGSGLLIGLPGYTYKIMAKDLLFLKKYDFDMVGIGPFIPSKNTPLSNEKVANIKLVLKANAITRLMLVDINIPATTALESIDRQNGRKMALLSGANVIMPSITSGKYHELYSLYPGKFRLDMSVENTYKNFNDMLFDIGEKVSLSNGNSLRYNERMGL